MNDAQRILIEALHQSPLQYVLANTGGGSTVIGRLLSVPGGSRTILEAITPYHTVALSQFLGYAPEQFCSIETSQAMAQRAFERATQLGTASSILGVGCTAGLVSDRPKRGDHRFYLSIQSAERCRTWSFTFNKGSRDREEEEEIVTQVTLNALAEMSGIEHRLSVPFQPDENLQVTERVFDDLLHQFMTGQLSKLCVELDGRITGQSPHPKLLIPGSFNPLHGGHLQLAKVASSMTGQPAAFEISVTNVDKGRIPIEEVQRRIRQFSWRHALWLSHEPTFLGKAQLFSECTFVIGIDTAARLVMPKYYQDSEEQMLSALQKLVDLKCHFLVAGRTDDNGIFQTMDSVTVPPSVEGLFQQIPESSLRVDISSTDIRRKQ